MKNFSVTQNGKQLDPSKYTWDETAQSFSTNEDNLMLDFSDMDDCTFTTGSYCTFATGSYCTFATGYNCTFKTGSYCTFTTGSYCTFTTGYNCTFTTGFNCTFTTCSNCVVVRWDIFEVHQLVENETVKLNRCGVPGFVKVVETKDEILERLVEKLKTLNVDDLKKMLK